ncbi:MAG: hypothetical protein IJ187_11085 [Neisseriaceae bacterium]|nr:hypothetical protein [Neisseriaceae bacterium]
MTEQTLYQQLGVGKAAGDGEILRALQAKAQSGEWNLEKIREVKSVLLDEAKRAEYDKTIEPKPLSEEEDKKIQQVIAQYQMQMAMDSAKDDRLEFFQSKMGKMVLFLIAVVVLSLLIGLII